MQIKKGYADGPFGQLHYQQCGTGAPVIMVHQSPDSMVQFRPVMRPLAAAGIHAIAVDIPGCGMSETPDHPPTIAEYAPMVTAIMDHFGFDRASVLGHHTGAIIVTEATLQNPERVDRIVLNGPLPLTDEERAYFMGMVEREKAWAPRWDGGHLIEVWENRRAAQAEWSDLTAFHRHFIHGHLAGEQVWYAHDAVMKYRHEDAIPRITHPCLVLANTGDAIYAQSLRTREMRPDFAYAELEGGTIDIIDEQPDAWARAVAKFLLA
ncbi:MAG: alpha/beta fold hydrolase [Gammaproteobacteria bacterium]